ncbi:MAG: undecaprenyl/decaprenyl-phosphate alpha-N-acetylglucosaminyl 1-phosphate transferase [Bacteroidales bacterium]|nr:undecaprenyl/decaprenyl-phosphate alpha-N-acetylglucosaminyl 1-phosphate transferase [Bacteroidales bacterium]
MTSYFYLILFIDFVLALAVGAAIVKLLLVVSYKNRIFDIPDERKVHKIPVPRLGGMSFMPTLMIVTAFSIGFLYRLGIMSAPDPDATMIIRLTFMLGSAMLLYVLGILDDLSDLSYKMKFLVQFLASSILVSSGIWLNSFYGLFGIERIPFYIGMPFTVLLFMFITNAINMIDGIDGLASGIAMITLGILAFIFIRERRFIYSTVSVTMLGAVLAFWLFNVFGSSKKKTKLYMGDTGSLTLGLIICFLIVSICSFGGRNGMITNGKYIIIIFSSLLIPLMDVIRLFVTRIINHKSPFEADDNHIHHLLMRCGLTMRQTLVVILGMDFSIVVLNALMTRLFISNLTLCINLLFVVDIVIYLIILLAISRNVKLDSVPKS